MAKLKPRIAVINPITKNVKSAINQKTLQNDATKNAKLGAANRAISVIEDIQSAAKQGLFTFTTTVVTAKEFDVVRKFLKSKKIGALYILDNGLYSLRVYWGPNPKLKLPKEIKDQVEESWDVQEWMKNKKEKLEKAGEKWTAI